MAQDGSVILDRDLFVSEDGSIFVDGDRVDQFRMVAFDPEANYTKIGENYFEPMDTDAELNVRCFTVSWKIQTWILSRRWSHLWR